MSKAQIYVRAVLKWIIAALAAGNLIALFLFDYNTPVISQLFSGSSSVSAGQNAGSSGDSGTAGTTLTTEESDLSESESTIDTVETDSEAASASGESSDDAENASADITQDSAESENSSAVSPVITLSDDLPAFTTSELSLIVDLLIDQNLLTADDGYGNDATYDVTGTVREGTADGEYILTLSLTNEEGASTSVTAAIQTSD